MLGNAKLRHACIVLLCRQCQGLPGRACWVLQWSWCPHQGVRWHCTSLTSPCMLGPSTPSRAVPRAAKPRPRLAALPLAGLLQAKRLLTRVRPACSPLQPHALTDGSRNVAASLHSTAPTGGAAGPHAASPWDVPGRRQATTARSKSCHAHRHTRAAVPGPRSHNPAMPCPADPTPHAPVPDRRCKSPLFAERRGRSLPTEEGDREGRLLSRLHRRRTSVKSAGSKPAAGLWGRTFASRHALAGGQRHVGWQVGVARDMHGPGCWELKCAGGGGGQEPRQRWPLPAGLQVCSRLKARSRPPGVQILPCWTS